MKNIKLIFAALASFAALSCEKESLPQSTPESDLVPLVLTTGDDTKTSLQTDGSIHWSEADSIAVIDNGILGGTTNNHTFSISNIKESSATFSGDVRNSSTQICAVYPSSLFVSGQVGNTVGLGENRDITVLVPSEQTAKVGTFNDNLNISVAKTSVSYVSGNALPSTTSIKFKNVCALLSFTMPSTLPGTITSVTIASSVAIAGNMDIDYSGDTPRVESLSNPEKQITMVGNFTAGKTYWFVLAPVLLDGLSISVRMNDGTFYGMSTSNKISMTMGKYRSLGTLDFTKMSTFSYSAEHDFQNSVLQGTNVKVNFPSTDVSNVNITITNGDVTRNMTDANLTIENGTKVAVSRSNDATWPYLPSGNYTISGSYTMAGEVITISPETLTVARPEGITITGFNAYTSYTKYSAGDVSGANALKGSLIYVQASNINVSAAILAKYANLLSLDYTSSGKKGSIVTGTLTKEVVAPAYGEYSDIKYSFDGVVGATMSTKCHVTGIPYKLSLSTNDSGDMAWRIKDKVEWNGSEMLLGYYSTGTPTATKTFNVPRNTDVKVNVKGSVHKAWITDNKGYIIVSGTTVSEGKGGKNLSPETIDSQIKHDDPTLICKSEQARTDACVKITKLEVIYR